MTGDSLPPESALDDVALMLKVKGGDIEAFEVLVERHQHCVVGTVTKMLGDPSDAEDISQQVFVRVWQSAPRYVPTAKFTTWMMTITRNLVFNEMRRRKRLRHVPIDEEFDDHPKRELADDHAASPSEEVIDGEMRHAVDAAIASLPEAQRMAIVLRRYEGMAYEEIAKVLRVSVPAVKSILFRARADLKEKLKKFLGD